MNDIIYECNNTIELLDFMTNNHFPQNIINYVKKHLLCNDMINDMILYDDMLSVIYKHGYPLQCENFYLELML